MNNTQPYSLVLFLLVLMISFSAVSASKKSIAKKTTHKIQARPVTSKKAKSGTKRFQAKKSTKKSHRAASFRRLSPQSRSYEMQPFAVVSNGEILVAQNHVGRPKKKPTSRKRASYQREEETQFVPAQTLEVPAGKPRMIEFKPERIESL